MLVNAAFFLPYLIPLHHLFAGTGFKPALAIAGAAQSITMTAGLVLQSATQISTFNSNLIGTSNSAGTTPTQAASAPSDSSSVQQGQIATPGESFGPPQSEGN